MDLTNPRQRLTLAVILTAGLAALATSGPYYFTREAKGQTNADLESAWISGVVTVGAESPSDSPSPYFTVVVHDRGLGGDAAIHSQGRLVIGTQADDSVTWAELPIERDVPPSACAGASLCEVEFQFQLRPAPPRAGPVVISWTVESMFYRGSESSSGVQATDPTPAPTAAAVAALATLAGAGAGALVAFVLSRIAHRRQRIALVVTAIAAALASMAFVWQGVLVQHMPQGLAILAAISFAPLLVALPPRREGQARGEVLAAGTISIPVLLGAFNDQGTYRLVDIAAIFAAAGVCISVGAFLLAMTRNRQKIANSWSLGGGWFGVVALSVALIGVIAVATLLVAAGGTDYPLSYIAIPVVAYGLLTWGLWRWLNDSDLLLAVVGIALVVAAVLGWIAARMPYFLSPVDEPGWILPSLVFIGLGGIGLVALTLSYRDRRPGATPGRSD
ncbi:MAG: hypothetical protein WD830_02470 [Chloroflexota bacterium]